jgi:hypothetical protein
MQHKIQQFDDLMYRQFDCFFFVCVKITNFSYFANHGGRIFALVLTQ